MTRFVFWRFPMFFVFNRGRNSMKVFSSLLVIAAMCLIPVAHPASAFASPSAQGSNHQRLTVMKSKLDATRRSLSSAIAAMNSGDKADKEKNADDPRERLRGLDKEVGSLLSEVNDLIGKEEKAEKYDTSRIGSLETSVTELNARIESALQSTASARTGETANYRPKEKGG